MKRFLLALAVASVPWYFCWFALGIRPSMSEAFAVGAMLFVFDTMLEVDLPKRRKREREPRRVWTEDDL